MKKSILAVAVAAALPAAAFAQTSVTLYGVADVSIYKTNQSGQAGKIQMGANGLLNNGTGRLGVRGTEDLGGGMTASFNYEQGINAENGNTDSSTFQRQAWLGLAGKAGSVRLGRQLTPSFFGVAAWELTGAANYTAVGNQFGWAGGPSRNNSHFSYTTPNMSGFTATLGYTTDGDAGINNNKIDANMIYRGGPLVVGLSYNKVDSAADAGWAIGAKYNFGMVTVAASYQDPSDLRKGFSLGLLTKLGPAQLVLDAARDTRDSGQPSSAKHTDYVVEVLYPLSKRTTVYAAAHRDGAAKVNTTGLGVRHNF